METKVLRETSISTVNVNSKRKLSLTLNIRRYTTDVNGTIIADNTVPAAMAVAYPFHLFGEFDRQGGFAIADKICSVQNNTKLFGVYVWGVNTPLFFFNGLADINSKFQKGDLIFIYVDDLVNPNYFSFVQINAGQGAYASLVAQTLTPQLTNEVWGAFKMFSMEMTWTNDNQLDQLFYIIQTTTDSRYNINQRDPWEFYNENIPQKKIIIPHEMIVNQYSGISGLISFNNPLVVLSIILYV